MLMLARAGEILLAGLVAEILYLLRVKIWARPGILRPSPSETNLQARFFFVTVPLLVVMIILLVIADWFVAGNAARTMIRDRLSSSAQVASDSLPYFLETGQNLILNLATPDLLNTPSDQLPGLLALKLRTVPYFRQLFLLNSAGEPVVGYPLDQFEQIRPTQEELTGIQLGLRGVLVQTYTTSPWPGENTIQVSFIAGILNDQGQVAGILLGRTDLNSNPFTQPALQVLEGITSIGGEGAIVDENRRILYHSNPSEVMSGYIGRIPESTEFFDESSSTGTRNLVYYQPVVGRPWGIILTVPAEIAQQTALNIAIPVLIILAVLSAALFISLKVGLNSLTVAIKGLSENAVSISLGQLNNPLQEGGEDEIGQLTRAFEKMRVSLKARLEELNHLLVVSQGVAANLDAKESVRPVLEAALQRGIVAARVVLIREVTLNPTARRSVSFGAGQNAETYAYLDDQLFELMHHQEVFSIHNTARVRRLSIPPGAPCPGALVALALHHESQYYGVLWVAFDQPHIIQEEEIRFLTTLAGEAALAAANARLYASAEVGRKRLEAVLESTAEPVLVVDENSRLLLSNPAALQVPGLISSMSPGKPIQEVISNSKLLNMLLSAEDTHTSPELSLANNRIYYVSISKVVADGIPVGKVCILRDITHYKELEMIKSDFVATVSHDLRSPLTLMRGYATMLQMVGDLNEQQKVYARKIITGIESMAKLVNNLLDLGRIEAGIGLQIEKIPAEEIIENMITSVQPQAIQKNIQLSTDGMPKDKVIVEADRALLQQGLYNLVENAVKYTALGGSVNLGLQILEDTVVFVVRDSGIGVAPLDLPRLFEKFYRSGRKEAHQQRGTGMGLAIVKSIAERHGGRVWVESTLGKGSTFFLEIPFVQTQRSNEN
jgi:PAS domain S-box-containing protein